MDVISIAYFWPDLPVHDGFKEVTIKQILAYNPPAGKVGQHVYSILGYFIAVAMLEQRGEQPFEKMMEERIF